MLRPRPGLHRRDDRRPGDPRRRRAVSHVHQPGRVPPVAPRRQRRPPADALRPSRWDWSAPTAGSGCSESWARSPGWSNSSRTIARRGCRWPRCCGGPKFSWEDLAARLPELADVSPEVAQQVTYDAKYAGYLARQQVDIQRQQRLAARQDPRIPSILPGLLHLRAEAREKFERVRPVDLAQAGRISGITPADLAVLMVHLEGAGDRECKGKP